MRKTIAILVAAGLALLSNDALACSRVLWNANDDIVVVVRSMDWSRSFEDMLFINPRGMKMDGGVGKGSVKWTSKYGSVVSSITGYVQECGFDRIMDGATDGINEKGFAAHLLYLGETGYKEDDNLPGLSSLRWVRYLLDNFATVGEAVDGMKKIKIVSVPPGKEKFGLHLAVDDPTGDSAIFEYINGELVVHHGREFTVMTNDPPYDEQIENLKEYKTFGGDKELPGGIEGSDRFVRGSYFVKFLPKPEDNVQAAGYAFSIIRNIAVPFGAPYGGRPGEDVYPTWWMSATDLTNKVFYFDWVNNPNIIWVDIDDADLSEGRPVMELDPKNPALTGDVTRAFTVVRVNAGNGD